MNLAEALTYLQEDPAHRLVDEMTGIVYSWADDKLIHLETDGRKSTSYRLINDTIAWEHLPDEPKLFWRRTVKHDGRIYDHMNWYESKEEFMESYDHCKLFGPWESREEPEWEER